MIDKQSQQMRDYIAYCPSCGHRLVFGKMGYHGDMRCCPGFCNHAPCKRRWSFLFDVDPSGTFGVMSFQCDNKDRVMEVK